MCQCIVFLQCSSIGGIGDNLVSWTSKKYYALISQIMDNNNTGNYVYYERLFTNNQVIIGYGSTKSISSINENEYPFYKNTRVRLVKDIE